MLAQIAKAWRNKTFFWRPDAEAAAAQVQSMAYHRREVQIEERPRSQQVQGSAFGFTRVLGQGHRHPNIRWTARNPSGSVDPGPDDLKENNMEISAVEQLIRTGLPGAQVQVSGDGSHFEALVVSGDFEGLTPIKKQRLVMDTVKAQIASGELHALSIKTLTPEQWAAQQG